MYAYKMFEMNHLLKKKYVAIVFSYSATSPLPPPPENYHVAERIATKCPVTFDKSCCTWLQE